MTPEGPVFPRIAKPVLFVCKKKETARVSSKNPLRVYQLSIPVLSDMSEMRMYLGPSTAPSPSG